MAKKNMMFRKLHQDGTFFVLANAWDVISSRIYESAGYKAIGSSSWATAWINNAPDGENIDFNIVLNSAAKISKLISVPYSVDIEKGYSVNNNDIANNVMLLAEADCSGINIEDSSNDAATLISPDIMSARISEIRNTLNASNFSDFVINARTDTYLCPIEDDIVDETIKRGLQYKASGADCLFVPGLKDLGHITKIAKAINMPLNVMNVLDLPDIDQLKRAGVTRLSLGNSAFDDLIAHFERRVIEVKGSNKYSELYNHNNLSLQMK